MTASCITPADLGLPAKFSTWRPGQWPSLETVAATDRRFIAQSAPTGFGKSVWAVATSILDGGRGVILTSTKALQRQYEADFSSCGMTDMRGRNNYECIKKEGATCAEGRILACRDAGCPYNANRTEFLESRLGVTNYSYLLSATLHSEGAGKIDLLVMDEAHAAISELCSAVEIRLNHNTYSWIYSTLNRTPPYQSPLAQWRTWAKFTMPIASSQFALMKKSGSHKGLSQFDAFISTITRIAGVSEDWILDDCASSKHETVISPLWPTAFAESLLFGKIPRVILVSATLVPKTLGLLGIKEEESLFLSQDHTFDPNRAPVYLFGPSRIDHKSTEGQLQEWVGRMDTIIDHRLDRKGIIHTVSYDKQAYIKSQSAHSAIMIAPKAHEFQRAVEEFRASAAPAILVTPAATTGYDFAYDAAEYQIIAKVPFIDKRSPIMAARDKSDPEYMPYLTTQTLVQTCGRIMRAPDDMGETFILDSHANWFLKKRSDDGKSGGYRHLFPPWFLRQVRYPDGLPAPPKPLSMTRKAQQE